MHDNSRRTNNLPPNKDLCMKSQPTPLRFVLDTNIVMDMLHFSDVHTHTLLDAIVQGTIACYCDNECLAELERVVAYSQFALTAPQQDELKSRYRSLITMIEVDTTNADPLPRCGDPDDQKFLTLAARCQANALITRDKLLLKLARHRLVINRFVICAPQTAMARFGRTDPVQ